MKRFGILLVLLILTLMGSACTPHGVVFHSFEFNALEDSPDVEVLNYRYGNGLITRTPDWQLEKGIVQKRETVTGPMLRGDFLYVKWRIKATGKVYEDTVDLKKRLPAKIEDHTIYFVIRGDQLSVYLISPKRKDGCPRDYSDKARKCIERAMAANHGAVVGCPPDVWKAVSDAPPGEKVFFKYCIYPIKTIYPDK